MATKTTKQRQPCPLCGGQMVFKAKADRIEYKGHEKTIQTKGWWCGSCNEGILDADALRASERAFLALKADVDGLLRPENVARIRKKLRLSQRRAGEILGGGPRAFQKYESGQTMLSKPMSNLLRLLEKYPSLIKELDQSGKKAAV